MSTGGGLDIRAVRAFEKEAILRKDFHDFHTVVSVRSRPGGVREFQFQISLLIEPADVWRRQVSTDYVGDR